MLAESSEPLLVVDGISSGYGPKRIIDSVDLSIRRGEVVAIIGHNGAGKSTLMKALFGLLPLWAGRIKLDSKHILKPNPQSWLRAGVAFIPQGNRAFESLSVLENLTVAALPTVNKGKIRAAIEDSLARFPVLKDKLPRRARSLSGGEKQALALAMGLTTSPRLVLLDEPSLGLAPGATKSVFSLIHRLSKEQGVGMLVVEQKVRAVLSIADRVVVLRSGTVSFSGDAEDLKDDRKLREVFL